MGFGDDVFGPLGFGHIDWGRKAIWENVPQGHRNLDENQYLEKLLKVFQEELEITRQSIDGLPLQREPYEARGQEDEGEDFYITSSEKIDDDVYGATLKFVGDISDFPTGYSVIERVGPNWTMNFNNVTYTVVLVKSRNYPDTANEIWVKGSDEILSFERVNEKVGVGDGTASPGVTIVDSPLRISKNPSTDINTAGISVTVVFDVGGSTVLYDNGSGELREDVGGFATGTQHGTVDYAGGAVVLSISGDVSKVGDGIYATYSIDGFVREFVPPSMLNYLAKDFGIENDLNDPESVQRSAIANVTKYLGFKSTQDSYRVRGEISGFDVEAIPVFLVCDEDLWDSLPARYKYDVGGKKYATIAPRKVLFDDIAADVQFLDPDTLTLVPLTDNELMYEDDSDDGLSVGQAFGIDVTSSGIEILSSTPLTDAEKITYSLASGHKLTVSMTSDQYAIFNIRKGVFGITPDYPSSIGDTVYWIDNDVSYAGGIWTVIIGSVDSVVDDPSFPGYGAVNAALRYNPEVVTDCCYCRSHKMIVSIQDNGNTDDIYSSGAEVSSALTRLKTKIQDILVPIHVDVVDYVYNGDISLSFGDPDVQVPISQSITSVLVVEQLGITAGGFVGQIVDETQFAGATQVLLDIEIRGDFVVNTAQARVNYDASGVTYYTGNTPDAVNWYKVVDGLDQTSRFADAFFLETESRAVSGAGGDFRYTFTITTPV